MATATLTRPKSRTPAKAAPTPAPTFDKMHPGIVRACGQFALMSDPTRFTVILMLAEGERHVGGICEALGMSQPSTSHHLTFLRTGGLIVARRQGKNNFYGLTTTGKAMLVLARKAMQERE